MCDAILSHNVIICFDIENLKYNTGGYYMALTDTQRKANKKYFDKNYKQVK